MAHDGHIHHENYSFIGTNELAPTSAIARDLDLY
jgi:hypothetical protein